MEAWIIDSHPVEAVVGCVWWMKSTKCCGFFFPLTHVVHYSALISNIYWWGIVSHQHILMVRHVAPAEIIGAANAAPAAPVPTPMVIIEKAAKFEIVPSCKL